ncbi:hypothetical protein BDR05DRAFT_1006541 [Suillus weaverae]|nr:hypothetical protein BDR05DRAFT_1006541 [Suillus weaverae]
MMGQSDQFSQVQHALASSCSSSLAPSLVRGSTSEGSYAPLPHLRPPITPISTHYSDRNVISLNSPEPQHDDESNGQYSFFSSFKKPTSNRDTPPHNSDSDISASNAMRGLQVAAHKASPSRGRPAPHIMKLSGASTRSTSPQSSHATSSHPPSLKRANNDQASTAATTAEQLSETAWALIQQVSEKRDGRVEHKRYKRMKLESDMWARELKVCNAHDEREHAMRLTEQDHLHKRELMGHQMEHVRLELELAHARREEEEARIRRITMEWGLDHD